MLEFLTQINKGKKYIILSSKQRKKGERGETNISHRVSKFVHEKLMELECWQRKLDRKE